MSHLALHLFQINFTNSPVQDNIVRQSFMLPAMLQKYSVLAEVTIMPFYTYLIKCVISVKGMVSGETHLFAFLPRLG